MMDHFTTMVSKGNKTCVIPEYTYVHNVGFQKTPTQQLYKGALINIRYFSVFCVSVLGSTTEFSSTE